MTDRDRAAVLKAATLLVGLGATEVFLFGSAVKGGFRGDSDVDMAVSGLQPSIFFSAVGQASDIVGRPVDLVDLDDDSGRVRYLKKSGDLVRVG